MADWFEATGVPSTDANFTSATIRNEFKRIESGISAKLPTLTANLPVFVGSSAAVLKSNSIATATSLLDLEKGVDVQAYDAGLASIAGLTTAANKIPYTTASDTYGVLDFKDDDTMTDDSVTALISQQSANAYMQNNLVVSDASFFAYLMSPAANVTGGGTEYTVAFDTEESDLGGDFNTSTYTFTAPDTGLYQFSTSVDITGKAAATYSDTVLKIITTGMTYYAYPNWGPVVGTGSFASGFLSILAPMTAGDTAYVTLTVSGGTDVVDVQSGASHASYFCGYRVL